MTLCRWDGGEMYPTGTGTKALDREEKEDLGVDTARAFRDVTEWYRWYHNFQRPHWSLGLRTLAEVYLGKGREEVRETALKLQKGLARLEILQGAA